MRFGVRRVARGAGVRCSRSGAPAPWGAKVGCPTAVPVEVVLARCDLVSSRTVPTKLQLSIVPGHLRCCSDLPGGITSMVGLPSASRRVTSHRRDHEGATATPVGAMVVPEQDGVDRSEVVGRQRWFGELCRLGAPSELVGPAGRVERRIGENPPSLRFDDDGRSADVCDADSRHAGPEPVVLAWLSAQSRA